RTQTAAALHPWLRAKPGASENRPPPLSAGQPCIGSGWTQSPSTSTHCEACLVLAGREGDFGTRRVEPGWPGCKGAAV
ncbi:MAG: hypothetical protein WBF88_02685, partial [Pusillimonas sp.]